MKLAVCVLAVLAGAARAQAPADSAHARVGVVYLAVITRGFRRRAASFDEGQEVTGFIDTVPGPRTTNLDDGTPGRAARDRED